MGWCWRLWLAPDVPTPRFLARDRTIDAVVELPEAGLQPRPDPLGRQLRTLAALPEVAEATRVREAIVASPDPAGSTGRPRNLGLLPLDTGANLIYGHPIVVAGRLPNERQADEAVIDEELAKRRHLWVGSVWRVGAYTSAQLEQAGSETPTPPAGPTVGLRIVGIVRHPIDLRPPVTAQDNLYVNHGDLYLTPAYWHRYGPDIARYNVLIGVTLDRGPTDLPQLATDVRRLLGPNAGVGGVDPGGGLIAGPLGPVPGLRRAIRLEYREGAWRRSRPARCPDGHQDCRAASCSGCTRW